MITRRLVYVFVGSLAGAVTSWSAALADFGDPLPGLTDDENARFMSGRETFAEEETAADGLGPHSPEWRSHMNAKQQVANYMFDHAFVPAQRTPHVW